MGKATLFLLGCLIFTVKSGNAQNGDCIYEQNIEPGPTYYVYNPSFPNKYQGQQECTWTIRSEYGLNLSCSVNMPRSTDCNQDQLSVETDGRTAHKYCGSGSFNIQSKANVTIIQLNAPYWTSGGQFLCEARVEEPFDKENCQCGWKNPTRIVGGKETGVNEFPMMAGLVDSVDRIVRCGATIIDRRYVLTAAHCIYNRDITKFGVLVGDHDLTTGSETNVTVLLRIIRAVMHPQYSPQFNLNDLAILKTEKDIVYSNKVGPACLPFQHSPDTFGGDFVEQLGWGFLDTAGPPSDTLQKVTLSVLTPLECSKIHGNISSNQMCTYADGKDACGMDSGGPVLWRNPTSEREVLIGVISSGVLCAVSGGVNVRVGAYIDWIVSVTPDAQYCIIE